MLLSSGTEEESAQAKQKQSEQVEMLSGTTNWRVYITVCVFAYVTGHTPVVRDSGCGYDRNGGGAWGGARLWRRSAVGVERMPSQDKR